MSRLVAATRRTSSLCALVPPTGSTTFSCKARSSLACIQRHFAHLVQKQRAPLGQFEPAGLVLYRPGKGAFLVAEQFALQQPVGQGGAVD